MYGGTANSILAQPTRFTHRCATALLDRAPCLTLSALVAKRRPCNLQVWLRGSSVRTRVIARWLQERVFHPRTRKLKIRMKLNSPGVRCNGRARVQGGLNLVQSQNCLRRVGLAYTGQDTLCSRLLETIYVYRRLPPYPCWRQRNVGTKKRTFLEWMDAFSPRQTFCRHGRQGRSAFVVS